MLRTVISKQGFPNKEQLYFSELNQNVFIDPNDNGTLHIFVLGLLLHIYAFSNRFRDVFRRNTFTKLENCNAYPQSRIQFMMYFSAIN